MTATNAPQPHLASVHNQQAFAICITSTLQLLGAIEFAPVIGQAPPPRDHLEAYADQLERHSQDVAALAGSPRADVISSGRAWYSEVSRVRRSPLQAAYHALHSAAWLGLENGVNAASMLAGVAAALRDLAQLQERTVH
ncbi:hypothetical protein [Deinococcus multiflagellatus]|uniref:hypothetical protein n=1 Tax=Deinococcus multiflagellatus TaxID=1656887 RepID=UPI001CCEFE43|nr:hypothetical protein [Deinococcus multiflagellatus]MBZ9714899.1 hypothetical protein [Deinococcus multiflagellatus]